MGLPLKTSTLTYSFAIAAWLSCQAPFAIPADYRPDTAGAGLQRLQPALSRAKAGRLAGIFQVTSARADCQIPWEILGSIAFHESSLGLHTENTRSGDHSLMQINVRTIRRLRLDEARLKRDVSYAVQVSCRVLRSNRDAYADHRPYWLGVYRSGTRFSNPAIIRNARSYSRMILSTAATLGYRPATELALAH